MAVFFIPLVTLSLSGLSPDQIPAASGLFNFARITAGSFGTSIATTFWDHRASLHHAQLAEHITPYDPATSAGAGAACRPAGSSAAAELRDAQPDGRPAGVHAVGQRHLLRVGAAVPALIARRLAGAAGAWRRGAGAARPQARTEPVYRTQAIGRERPGTHRLRGAPGHAGVQRVAGDRPRVRIIGFAERGAAPRVSSPGRLARYGQVGNNATPRPDVTTQHPVYDALSKLGRGSGIRGAGRGRRGRPIRQPGARDRRAAAAHRIDRHPAIAVG